MRLGWGIFNCSSCGTLINSLVHIIISAHTWPATYTDVKDPSKRSVTEPHKPTERPLMEPVKSARHARAASLISSSNYCWGRIMPCIAMWSLSQADTQKGKMSLFFFFFAGSWSQHRQLCLLISGSTCTNTYGHYNSTKKNKRFCILILYPVARMLISESQVWPNGGFSAVENKPLSSWNTLYMMYKH